MCFQRNSDMQGFKECAECERLCADYNEAVMSLFRLQCKLQVSRYSLDGELTKALLPELCRAANRRHTTRRLVEQHESGNRAPPRLRRVGFLHAPCREVTARDDATGFSGYPAAEMEDRARPLGGDPDGCEAGFRSIILIRSASTVKSRYAWFVGCCPVR